MPGTVIRERTARIARSLPTDTGTFFLAGLSDRGVGGQAEICLSVDEFERKFGARQTYSSAWDMVDAYFREGGSRLYFSRVLGPAVATAFVILNDAVAVASLRVSASSPGDWGNALNIAVVAGDAAGEFKLVLTHDTDTTINETSPSFADQAAAAAWAENHDLIRVTVEASADDPAVVAAQSLAGGEDDRDNIADANWLTALNAFGPDLGPGQVAAVNRTSLAAHGQLADHAKANNRVALYDPPDTTSKTTLLGTASSVKGMANGRYGALFAPWVKIGSLTPGGTLRTIPPSAVVAGVMARSDSLGHSPNEPAAGERGLTNSINELKATFVKADADELNEASVNLILEKKGDFRVYGYRSGVSKAAGSEWWQFGNVRLYMAIAAQADNILERFVLRQIDGKGLVFKELEGQLSAMLVPFYEQGSLHGETPEEAFVVDTGPQVNTTATKEAGEIHAVIELTMSPMGETVILDIVKRSISA